VECGYTKTMNILSYMKPKKKIYSPVNQGKKDKKKFEKALDLITFRKNTYVECNTLKPKTLSAIVKTKVLEKCSMNTFRQS
jgi:hypothetical protein